MISRRIFKMLPLFLAMVFSLLNVSCEFTENNKGYPNKISFPKDGGMQIAKGETFFYGLSIEDGDAGAVSGPPKNDTLEVRYRWLTIKSPWCSNKLIVIAKPSQSNQKRELEIRGDFGIEYAIIKVSQ